MKRKFVVELEIEEEAHGSNGTHHVRALATCWEVERFPRYEDSGDTHIGDDASLVFDRSRSYSPDFLREYWLGRVGDVLKRAFVKTANEVKLWDPPFPIAPRMHEQSMGASYPEGTEQNHRGRGR
jgi:hypothetical protein